MEFIALHHVEMPVPGDASGNALAESVRAISKTGVIRRQGPWRSLEALACATRTWVDWFNTRRLPEPIKNVPPAEFEET